MSGSSSLIRRSSWLIFGKLKITVVIPTRNRCDLLRKTLLSLTTQSFPKDDIEVLVSNHASTDDTIEVCESFTRRLDIDIIDVPYEGYSTPRAKNAGIYHASNELLIMVDCGMICPHHFLNAHHDAHLAGEGLYVSGPAYGWDVEDVDDFWRSIDPLLCPPLESFSGRISDCRLRMTHNIRWAPWMLFWGCNFSVRTLDLRQVGAFDEELVGWGWDDIELGVRCEEAGLRFLFEPLAWCLHYPHPRQTLAERMVQGTKNWIRAYNKHPSPRLELWEAVDYIDYDQKLTELLDVLSLHSESVRSVEQYWGNDPLEGNKRVLYWGFNDGPDQIPGLSVVCPLPHRKQGETIYSFGIRTPFSDKEFDQVIISSYWRFLAFSLSPSRPRALHFMLKEALRIGANIVFVDLHSARKQELGILEYEIGILERKEGNKNRFHLGNLV